MVGLSALWPFLPLLFARGERGEENREKLNVRGVYGRSVWPIRGDSGRGGQLVMVSTWCGGSDNILVR